MTLALNAKSDLSKAQNLYFQVVVVSLVFISLLSGCTGARLNSTEPVQSQKPDWVIPAAPQTQHKGDDSEVQPEKVVQQSPPTTNADVTQKTDVTQEPTVVVKSPENPPSTQVTTTLPPEEKSSGINILGLKLPERISLLDIVYAGKIKPTVYYLPQYTDQDQEKCTDAEKQNLIDENGATLAAVCPKIYQQCALQGTCELNFKGEKKLINIVGRKKIGLVFFEVKNNCTQGLGVKNICLDAFYTLAADLTIYKPGQVVFIPQIIGTALPDGSLHNGFFVIRDMGYGIRGEGRFDFFSGVVHWRDKKSPFTQHKLADVNTRMDYFLVGGESMKAILQLRAFPLKP